MKLQKLTHKDRAAHRRHYDDACGMAHALDLIGERWALLVVRELMFGPKRFSDLRGDLPGISANVLTQRLEGLESAGLLRRRKLPPPAASHVYELTAWGYETEPILQTLGRWAARSPLHDPTLPISAVSLMLSFRTMFDAARAGNLRATIAFRFGEEDFAAEIAKGRLTVARATNAKPDVAFSGTPAGLAAAVYGGQALTDLGRAGMLTVTGDMALARRFLTLFPLPAKVATADR